MAHPGVKKFYDPEKDKETHSNVFLGLFPNPNFSKEDSKKMKINLNPAIENFQMTVGNYIDRATGAVNWQPGMAVQIKLLRKKDIPDWAMPEGGKYRESEFENIVEELPIPVQQKQNNNKRRDRDDEATKTDGEAVVNNNNNNKKKSKKDVAVAAAVEEIKEEEETMKSLLETNEDSQHTKKGTQNEPKQSEHQNEQQQQMKISFASVVRKGGSGSGGG